MCCASVPPLLFEPLVNATHGLALIMPVAGEVGLLPDTETVYVNFVEEITVIGAVISYCDWFAPKIASFSFVKSDAVDATVAVAVVPLLVNDVIVIVVPGALGAVPKVRVVY